jgi:hypothetical protein
MAEASSPALSPRPIPWAAVETAAALLALAGLVSDASVRALLAGCLRAIADGVRSTVLLLPVDPATLLTTLGAVARAALLLAPVVRALAAGPRHRIAWLGIGLVVWVGVFGTSLPGVCTVLGWALFAVAGGAAWLAAARPAVRAAVFLPWIVALEPMLGHGPVSDDVWAPSRLAARCAGNDGVRPIDLTPGVEQARYYAVTPATPEHLLLTGERRSFWVLRGPDGTMRLGPPLMGMTANLWQGCVRDGRAWLTARAVGVCETPVPSGDGPAPTPICHPAPGSPDLGLELDYVDALCPAGRSTVYASQLLRGGYLELDPRTDATTWHPVVPGLNLQMVMRRDGRIVAITTGRLVVFDPASNQVLEEHPAGAVAMGVDVCATDDALAVTDFTGRVRLFERGEGGRYRLRAGVFLPAPRRVAFSPGCDRLVVTSGDDRRAFLVRRSDLAVVRTYRLGPGLRDVVFVDDRHAAAADACTVSVLDAEP